MSTAQPTGGSPDAAFGAVHLLDQEARLTAARQSGDEALCADLAIGLARAYARTGAFDAALERIELALDVLERSGLRHRLGAAYVTHAMVSFYRDRPSQALSALSRAAGYPDLSPADKVQMYDIAGLALIYLVDLPTGADVLLEEAWPQALLCNDPKTIVNMAARCIGLLHEMACWADGAPSQYRLGVRTEAPRSREHYLDRAGVFIAEMDARLDAVSGLDQASGLAQTAMVLSLQDGYDSALPTFERARTLATLPRLAMVVDINAGRAAALDGRWETAHGHFMRARSLEISRDDAARRTLAWHLSYVEEALGRPAAALREMREFEAFEAKKSRLAADWFVDADNRRRYGDAFDIGAAREMLLGKPLPASLAQAMRFIDDHLARQLTPEAVAAGAHVGKRTLQNLFREHLGVTISDFVRERRMQRADEALRAGGARIADIAEGIGYSSAANFSRDYRKRFGRPPSATSNPRRGVARTSLAAATAEPEDVASPVT